ncbi:N-terminal double-transmembrane domain protein [Formosa agariphila KMM 3901]|uniref:N-terminal double-transmembrane domain protein n=1 Tax=Formosa agariphila (strain DSM 15362 / KCTC 12365 / LMG 23005 / KMM 3901 / M-2Alg 35-1) TaxID=1347342 RepID=T2KLZ0_FORAG|nr:BatA domain-containing protein [Formosa agariphila]CDF79446.1 N-terminal double-transmembrane domain protein [Formosa agariphila KMM 3901]
MQFKHPELLYTLFLLLIPIIIHLFQLRRFKKEAFTNVAILKTVSQQTRKSSQIKKWLTLLTRLLLLGCIILAFAQPFTTKKNIQDAPQETVVFLDNSFSLQQKGAQGELLKRAVQDLISEIDFEKNISIVTHDAVFKNTTIKAIKNELLQLPYTSNPLSYNAAVLKSRSLFNSNSDAHKQLVFISDFQEQETPFSIEKDSLIQVNLVKLKPANTNNIALDSVYISKVNPTQTELTLTLKNSGQAVDNLSIALHNNNKLIAKSAVSITDKAEVLFTIPSQDIINGTFSIEDAALQFDNTLYFNINTPSKINVLSISDNDDTFLRKIYTEDEFIFTSVSANQLDYNIIENQNTIVLNALKDIPITLIHTLKSFTDQGGTLIIIPSEESNINAYNSLLLNYNSKLGQLVQSDKRITMINYSHPIYQDDVFEKQVQNFQYPKVNQHFNLTGNSGSSALSFEDGKSFLSQFSNVFLFSSPINSEGSNFKSWALIVPTFYKMAVQSLQHPKLYYTIGTQNTFDIDISLNQDDIISIKNEQEQFIPQQQYFNNKVSVITTDRPETSGIFSIENKLKPIKNISYNYNRSESDLMYQDLSPLKNVTISDSIPSLFDTLKSNTKINELWKWFTIFALAFLIIEMLILKFFK